MSLFGIHHHVHQTVDQDMHVTVTEKRAPTDASVALLREMEAEAKKAVVAAVRVTDCDIDVVVHIANDLMNDRRRYRIVYSVNGKRRVVETHTDGGASAAAIAQKLVDVLAREISFTLLEPHFAAALKDRP